MFLPICFFIHYISQLWVEQRFVQIVSYIQNGWVNVLWYEWCILYAVHDKGWFWFITDITLVCFAIFSILMMNIVGTQVVKLF